MPRQEGEWNRNVLFGGSLQLHWIGVRVKPYPKWKEKPLLSKTFLFVES